MSNKIQRVRLMRPLVLTGHEHPEQLNVDADENLKIELTEKGIQLKWTHVLTKELCESFVPFPNIIQIIWEPEAVEKVSRIPPNPVGRPAKAKNDNH